MTGPAQRGHVPMARRQLMAEPAKLAVTLAAVAAAMALVLLLAGLRQGIGDQTTLYVDRQAPVLVGQKGVRNFIAQPSVLPDAVGVRVAAVPGVASVTPVTEGYAMFRLHGQRALTLLVGYDEGRGGGPWDLGQGRRPSASALRRPFAYFPLAKHFEQEFVAARVERHGAGRRLDFSQTTPSDLAETIVELLGRRCWWPPVRTDGAERAARLIGRLSPTGAGVVDRGAWACDEQPAREVSAAAARW